MSQKDLSNAHYWLAFGLLEELSLGVRAKLVELFCHPKEAFAWARQPKPREILKLISPDAIEGTGETFDNSGRALRILLEAVRSRLNAFSFARVEQELRSIDRLKAELVTQGDAAYPVALRELVDPPAFLIVERERSGFHQHGLGKTALNYFALVRQIVLGDVTEDALILPAV